MIQSRKFALRETFNPEKLALRSERSRLEFSNLLFRSTSKLARETRDHIWRGRVILDESRCNAMIQPTNKELGLIIEVAGIAHGLMVKKVRTNHGLRNMTFVSPIVLLSSHRTFESVTRDANLSSSLSRQKAEWSTYTMHPGDDGARFSYLRTNEKVLPITPRSAAHSSISVEKSCTVHFFRVPVAHFKLPLFDLYLFAQTSSSKYISRTETKMKLIPRYRKELSFFFFCMIWLRSWMHSFCFYWHTSSKKDIKKKKNWRRGTTFMKNSMKQSENLNASFLLYMFTNVLLLDII